MRGCARPGVLDFRHCGRHRGCGSCHRGVCGLLSIGRAPWFSAVWWCGLWLSSRARVVGCVRPSLLDFRHEPVGWMQCGCPGGGVRMMWHVTNAVLGEHGLILGPVSDRAQAGWWCGPAASRGGRVGGGSRVPPGSRVCSTWGTRPPPHPTRGHTKYIYVKKHPPTRGVGGCISVKLLGRR